MRQFIFESVMFVLVSTIIAIVATEVSLGAFNTMANTRLSFHTQLVDPSFIALLGGFILLLGMATGSYPAFISPPSTLSKCSKGNL